MNRNVVGKATIEAGGLLVRGSYRSVTKNAVGKATIEAAGLPIRGSYRSIEVCKILGISKRTFFRMISQYEPNPATGKPINPATLDSYKILSHRRVRLNEIIDYIYRNNTYEAFNKL